MIYHQGHVDLGDGKKHEKVNEQANKYADKKSPAVLSHSCQFISLRDIFCFRMNKLVYFLDKNC